MPFWVRGMPVDVSRAGVSMIVTQLVLTIALLFILEDDGFLGMRSILELAALYPSEASLDERAREGQVFEPLST